VFSKSLEVLIPNLYVKGLGAPVGPAHSPVFCGHFLHDLDLEITLGNQPLQPRILSLVLLQAPAFFRLKATETLAPCRQQRLR
jgi:hypothetical protein